MAFETKLKSDENDELFVAIMSLDSIEECYRFFTDICTINELKSISQRFQVAKLLSEDHTYNEIEEKTNASTATISRINKCLTYGADGYRIVLEKMKNKKDNER